MGFRVSRSRLPHISAFSDNGVVALLDPAEGPGSVASGRTLRIALQEISLLSCGSGSKADKETEHA